jgi:hypothetical protein
MPPQVRRKPDVMAESLPDGSMVLFDPTDMMAYPISASAAVIWASCDSGRTTSQIVEDLLSIYDAPRDTIERDIETFISQLLGMGLLVPARPNGVETR